MAYADLRDSLVDRITGWQPLPDAVAAAMRTVERHLFVPGVPPEDAYRDDTVVTRRDDDGNTTSSASTPSLVGLMLGQLQVRPGMKVLEIGGGTGYNAALLGELTGPGGHVTAVEIDSGVAADAREALAAAGADNVEMICGDGEYGHPANAPYDRIIATAGTWEIPDAWADQLAPGGILVVPLRMQGLTQTIAFKRDEQAWRSISSNGCGFLPMRGDGGMPERNIRITGHLTVRFDDGRDADAGALGRAAAGPGVVEWTGALIDAPLDLLDYFLAGLNGFCRILAPGGSAGPGMADPVHGWGSMGVATAGSIGYLTKRTSPVNPHVQELGVCAYGPAAEKTARDLHERACRWDSARKTAAGVHIRVYPEGQYDAAGDELMIVDKRHSRLVVTLAVKPES